MQFLREGSTKLGRIPGGSPKWIKRSDAENSHICDSACRMRRGGGFRCDDGRLRRVRWPRRRVQIVRGHLHGADSVQRSSAGDHDSERRHVTQHFRAPI